MSKSTCSPATPRDSVMVGMPDVAVRESRERIKSALMNSGFGYPEQAHHDQSGAGQCAQGRRRIRSADGARDSRRDGRGRAASTSTSLLGELSLDGAIRPVRGALSVAVCAKEKGIPNLIVPAENAAEAAVVEGVNVFGVRHLAEVVALLTRPEEFAPVRANAQRQPRRSRGRSGLPRRARAGHGEARARSRGGRRAQRADDRPAWLGQDDAGEAAGRASCRR